MSYPELRRGNYGKEKVCLCKKGEGLLDAGGVDRLSVDYDFFMYEPSSPGGGVARF